MGLVVSTTHLWYPVKRSNHKAASATSAAQEVQEVSEFFSSARLARLVEEHLRVSLSNWWTVYAIYASLCSISKELQS